MSEDSNVGMVSLPSIKGPRDMVEDLVRNTLSRIFSMPPPQGFTLNEYVDAVTMIGFCASQPLTVTEVQEPGTAPVCRVSMARWLARQSIMALQRPWVRISSIQAGEAVVIMGLLDALEGDPETDAVAAAPTTQ